MRLGGRMMAAVEVLEEMATTHRPASLSLADWGRSHRFAGSGDRAAIGNLVYDVLRNRASLTFGGGSDEAGTLVFAAVRYLWGVSEEDLRAQLAGDKHAPDFVTLVDQDLSLAPPCVQGDVPEWLWDRFVDSFDDEAIAEGRAMALRPPTDLRVNTLRATPEKVSKALAKFKIRPGELTPNCLRLEPTSGTQRSSSITTHEAYQKGWCEVQDQGSQIVSDLVYARPGEQILDYCAGAGGKTLALAAAMENRGQIFAFDRDPHRLAPIYDRLKRAGVRNAQVIGTDPTELEPLVGKMDRVLVDAPCSGSGVWRRRPEAKWKLTQDALSERSGEQAAVLADAKAYVKPGGYLCYVTCSILPDENEAQVQAFLLENPEFELVSVSEVWEELFEARGAAADLAPWSSDGYSVTLTPASTRTDGFFFAVMERRDLS